MLSSLGGRRSCWADIWVRSGWRVREHATMPIAELVDPHGEVAVSGTVEECLTAARRQAPKSGRRHAAILMHGLNRSHRSMRHLAARLDALGWEVANLDYPSPFRPLEAHAQQALGVARTLVEDGAERVAFVGHSLGGLVGRLALAKDWPGDRAVFIGSPNRGAALADWLSHLPGYGIITGAVGRVVTPVGAADLPVPGGEIGIVAGGTGGFGFNPWLGEDNDGMIRVSETRLGGAEADFNLLPVLHATMPRDRDVIEATTGFLIDGTFRNRSFRRNA
jgi:pimeloyl-ACP methyl ester carboxylesterase